MLKFTFFPKTHRNVVFKTCISPLFSGLFIVLISFGLVSFTKNTSPNEKFSGGGDKCNLTVAAGEDRSSCSGTEFTLTASISGASSCNNCVSYEILNTTLCRNNNNNSKEYAFFIKEGGKARFFSNVDLQWTPKSDGTATLKGTVFDFTDTQSNYSLDITYSGRTKKTPEDSPKSHSCHNENSKGWVYYTETSGTITSEDGTWSVAFSRRGPAFQLGKDANETESEPRTYGASGWFIGDDDVSILGDVNINIGDCIQKENDTTSYLWSTGETTASITVSESGTYTVTATDCATCGASDSVEVTINSLTVDAGEDQEICDGNEATLTATLSGQSSCKDCLSYEILNTTLCRNNNNNNSKEYVFYLKEGGKVRFFSNVDLQWTPKSDGTATLKGTVFDFTDTQSNYSLDITYSGRTKKTPEDSPKSHSCHNENSKGWVYYTETSGTITSEDGTWSVAFSRRGPAFQLGKDANETESEPRTYGASGWFIGDDDVSILGDVNINIGDCIQKENDTTSYLWSTGETTASITVSESGTYTVTATDCSSCEASDSIEVTLSTLTVDAGEDQEICGAEATLTATVSGAEACEDCVAYSIENSTYCELSQKEYVFYLVEGDTRRWFSNVDLEWLEAADGTATLKGTIFDFTDTQANYELDAKFYGATSEAPLDSPKNHICHDEDSTGWLYYTGFSGTVTSEDGTWSLDFTRRGPAFQIGNGANEIEMQMGKNGGSGWFISESDVTITGDLNFNFGSCTTQGENGIAYLWSTGETTPAITVTESGNYTVVVTGCEGCGEASDQVIVAFTEGLEVDLGEDQSVCDEEVVLTAAISGADDCDDCTSFDILDTERCMGTENYVMWISDDQGPRWFSNVDLVWSESADGTAKLSGSVADINNPSDIYVVGAIFTGKTTEAPSGSPKNHLCNDENVEGWEYYTSMFGIISSEDGSWSIDIVRRGTAFQVGNGANDSEKEIGASGGSGWFIASNDVTTIGDFNFIKGDCKDVAKDGGIEYLWSTGETTPSITVTESGTYSVVVKGCGGCEGFDEVVIDFNGAAVIADAGEDVEACIPPSSIFPAGAELTATGGDTYLWSTGETTASITVFILETTSYTVTAFKGTCSDTDDVLVTVVTCNDDGDNDVSQKAMKAAIYPTPQAADQGTVTVEVNNTVEAKSTMSFELYDINGKVIDKPASMVMELGRNKMQLAIPKLSPGVYLLQMMNMTNADRGFVRLIIE